MIYVRGFVEGDRSQRFRSRQALWDDCPNDEQGRERDGILRNDLDEVFFAERPVGGPTLASRCRSATRRGDTSIPT
jgi:hypothetical protein